ncbi:MAG TPA: iron chelate uptake ABC transporter family permease subunit [Dehalococcoidia bacterium]|nr:iron chelate uptake ABC transporter family permease subunit [Dehalococcoidia bacterium]
MALELLKDITIPKTATAYPLQWRSRVYSIVGLVLLLGVIVVATSATGSTHIPFATLWNVLLAKLPFVEVEPTWVSSVETIIFDIRMPRVFLAGLVGAALAVAGATYQGLFRNPLADPYLIGVAQGAALGAVIGFLLPVSWQAASIPLLAFAGALVAVAVVYSIAKVGKTLPMTTLILAGVALGAFLAAITSYLMIASGDKLHGIISWLLGTFSLTSWWQVTMVIPYIFIGIMIIWLHARPLNVMQLDEEQAQQLGINVEQVKLILLGAATLITAAAVCFCGIIGFVGIIIPHAVRLVWGPDHRFLLPLAIFAGASFLILADTAARTLLAPTEIPVGAITAFLGAPFFLYLLRQKKRAIF